VVYKKTMYSIDPAYTATNGSIAVSGHGS
jgi:hypothetical protein